jgi:signal transduction histidine kinase
MRRSTACGGRLPRIAILGVVRARGDLLLAAGLTALALIEAVTAPRSLDSEPGTEPWLLLPRPLVAGVAVALTASLSLRRRLPLLLLGIAYAWLAVAPAPPLESSVAATLALALAAYSVGAWGGGVGGLVGALGVGILTGLLVMRTLEPGSALAEQTSDLLVPLLLLVGSWSAGLVARGLRQRTAELDARAAELVARQDELARAAVEDERARIARELHDIVGHALGVIVLQARGARRMLPDGPAAVEEALGAIESTGSSALAETRRLVTAMRSPDEPAPREPWPGLAQLGELTDRVARAGLPVTLEVEGRAIDLPPGLDLVAYRVVQEALTNALAHAGPARATVLLRYLPDGLEVVVEDTGVGAAPDGAGGDGRAGRETSGLAGMVERVAIYGGTVAAGPRPDGGFRVAARLPLSGGGPTG